MKTNHILASLILLILTHGFESVLSEEEEGDSGCSDVTSMLRECTLYLSGDSIDPDDTCCAPLTNLSKVAAAENNTSLRICQCIQSELENMDLLAQYQAENLASKCNAQFEFEVSDSMACSSSIAAPASGTSVESKQLA